MHISFYPTQPTTTMNYFAHDEKDTLGVHLSRTALRDAVTPPALFEQAFGSPTTRADTLGIALSRDLMQPTRPARSRSGWWVNNNYFDEQ